ncbi:MAG: sensor histidine kinase [Parvibaculaceae bacterium]|nr:sensor histidine kinase [Parvibaculaceae bacterium]
MVSAIATRRPEGLDVAEPAGEKTDQTVAGSFRETVSRRLRGASRAFLLLLAQGRFYSLTGRIIAFNMVGLIALVSGVLYLNQFREGLIDARRQSLLTQAEIIAGAIAQSATDVMPPDVIDPLERRDTGRKSRKKRPSPPPPADEDLPIIPEDASPILRRLVVPTQTRARLYDDDAVLLLDSRNLTDTGQIVAFELPPPDWQDRQGPFTRLEAWAWSLLPGRDLPRYREAGSQDGTIYDEVSRALKGVPSSMERINDRGELIVSVAVPIQRYRAVLGALMLSTQGGDIDKIVRAERFAILQVALVALGVSILLSVVLAGTIAEPVRRLAESAEIVRRGKIARAQIPDFTSRRDEIGNLSGVLREMTNSLYLRIDAIESFAADVAHELKNPLTSLRSAIETLDLARDAGARARLMQIVQDDVRRIDRLISDISDASRLDAELSRRDMADVQVVTLLETVVDLFNETGSEEGMSVRLNVEEGPKGLKGFLVKGFDSRLGQVMRNLIDNALSFSPPGGKVAVTLRRAGDQVRILVEDEGPGIPPDNLARIFDRFLTDRPDSFGKHSGLGLSISRQIVEAHKGRIWAENRALAGEEGAGARFIVDLPAADAEPRGR